MNGESNHGKITQTTLQNQYLAQPQFAKNLNGPRTRMEYIKINTFGQPE